MGEEKSMRGGEEEGEGKDSGRVNAEAQYRVLRGMGCGSGIQQYSSITVGELGYRVHFLTFHSIYSVHSTAFPLNFHVSHCDSYISRSP